VRSLLKAFYEVCIRLGELGIVQRGKSEKYREDEYPSARDVEQLEREFQERINRPAIRGLNKEK